MSIKEFNDLIQENPKNLYDINVNSYIKTNTIPLKQALEIYTIKLKDNKQLYYYASSQVEKLENTLMNITMVLGWCINLLGMTGSTFDIHLSCSNLGFVTGIGNLITIICITFINISKFHEQTVNFKIVAHQYDKLQSTTEFKIACSNNTEELLLFYKDIQTKEHNIKESCGVIIPRRVVNRYYDNYGKQTFQEAMNDFYVAMSKKIIETNCNDEANSITNLNSIL